MEKVILSYSITGNNRGLAERIAKLTGFRHIELSEEKKRTPVTTLFDLWFKRIPKVTPGFSRDLNDTHLVFVGPVWMEFPATPFLSYMKQIKERNLDYSYITIAGGSLHKNPNMPKNLEKWAGKAPVEYREYFIADLLPQDPKPTMKESSSYRVSSSDLDKFASDSAKIINDDL